VDTEKKKKDEDYRAMKEVIFEKMDIAVEELVTCIPI